MSYKVDNAIIMAAGLSSRFTPLCYENPKALISVKGEVLIERQIRQLQEAGIRNIIVVVGYMKEKFYYLSEQYGVTIVENTEYAVRNNHSTIYAVRDYLKNSYICSADNYFNINPFEPEVEEAYYAASFSKGHTNEWCIEVNEEDWITDVTVGGEGCWYMLGHVFWTEQFSKQFLDIMLREYDQEKTKEKLWEAIYVEHIHQLKLKIRRYQETDIFEFDSLDELRGFDKAYIENTGSRILKDVAQSLGCEEKEIENIYPTKNGLGTVEGFSFCCRGREYVYLYDDKIMDGKIKPIAKFRKFIKE